MSALDAALKAASAYGWSVFPARADKSPYTKNGVLDASRDETQIRGWWRRWPGAMLAVAAGASGLVVLDTDVPKGGQSVPAPWCDVPGVTDGADLLVAYLEHEALLDGLLGTRIVRTRSGGLHFYWRDPVGMGPGVGARSWLGLPLVDIRAGNSYVIAAGPGYRTMNPGPVADAPAWLVERWQQRRPAPVVRVVTVADSTSNNYATAALNAECDNVATAAVGTRNDVLYAAAFTLSRLVAHGELAELAMRDGLASAASHAGLGEREAERTIASAVAARAGRT